MIGDSPIQASKSKSQLPTIGYLTGEFPRATDTWIQREIAGLRQQGFEVVTFSVRRPGEEHLVGIEQREGQATTSYLLEQAKSPALVGAHLRTLFRSPGRYLSAARLAWRTRRPGVRGSVYQVVYFVEAVLLADQVRARGIDHLHNHFGDSSCSVAMLAAKAGGFPFSFTLHGAAIFFEAHTWDVAEKIRQAAFVNTISYFARSQAAYLADTTDHNKLHIVHCGVEPARIQPVEHKGQGTRLLFVGRIVESKGIGVLFDALVQLNKRHTNLSLTIVGDGPDRASFEAQAVKLGLGETVTFVGARSQDEVSAHLAESDVFVLASFAEGLPVVLMEALAAELAAVATRVGGVQELVVDGVSGLVVPPGHLDALVEALDRLIVDPELRSSLGQAGRKMVLDEFDSANESARLGQLFVDSLGSLPSPTRPAALSPGEGKLESA